MTAVPARRARLVLLVGAGLVGLLAVAGCAEVPEPAAAPQVTGPPAPAVLPEQSERVRGEVAARLLAAQVAGDEALLAGAATGPAALLEALRVRVDGPLPAAEATRPVPAAVLVAPQGSGWPRWFATVTDPSTAPAPEPSPAASGEGVEGPAVVAELPVVELYTSEAARLPYRLWARLTMLPGATLPAFPAAEIGAAPLAGAGPAGAVPSGGPSAAPAVSAPAVGPSAGSDVDAADDAGLLAAVAGLAQRYASVMSDGDASPSAAEFEPDPFVEAVRARAAAEGQAVASVADTALAYGPLDGVEVLFTARAANGDVLAVTAVETTVTMTVRRGAGELRPGTEVRAAAGVEEVEGTLTTRSVATLAFLVPAEQGAIRLVAVGEGLVSASAG